MHDVSRLWPNFFLEAHNSLTLSHIHLTRLLYISHNQIKTTTTIYKNKTINILLKFSGLAVEPNNNNDDDDNRHPRDSVFSQAESVGANGAPGSGTDDEVRRTITMYRDGFIVDDGPYRRLTDPSNAEFLRSLATGVTPRELLAEGDVTVGLIDKRNQEYVEPFRSFSGTGASLGGAAATTTTTAEDGIIDVTSLPSTPPPVDSSQPTTSIQVRLIHGKRKVVKVNLTDRVQDLVAHLRTELEGTARVRVLAGFPPAPIADLAQTVEEAGLQGASVSLQAA